MNWNSIRAEFPSLQTWTYLNTATFGQLPLRATAAVTRHFAHRDEQACSDFLSWFDDLDRIRTSIAKLIHCTADDVAFIPNASTGLAMLLSGLSWRPGDRIVTLADEFPNNLYASQALTSQGVESVQCSWDQVDAAIDASTRVVVVSAVNYNTGFAPPLQSLANLCHARGALLFVDGTQGVGALQFDVGNIQPDMLAVHAYKWMLSPSGAGFLYVSPSLRARLQPQVIGWRSHHDWRSVDNLHHGAPVFSTRAEKYEGGMLPFALLYGMGASIELLLEIGMETIEQRVLDLADQVRNLVRELGGTTAAYRSPIVAARFGDVNPSLLASALKEKRILVAARKGYLRISPHLYNNEADLERLETHLRLLL